MKIIVFFLLFIVSAFSLNPQGVNLELQTSVLFEPKDAENNLSFIKNVKKFLEKIQDLVSPNQESTLTFRSASPKNKLTEFLVELGIVLNNYTDSELKNISIIFDNIVDELYFKESLFHEIFIESKLKNFIRTVSREWKSSNATILKKAIQKCLTNCEPVVSKFLRKLNKYYIEEDGKIFKKIVKRIRKYPAKKKDLTQVITDAVKYLVFDHYNALNYSSKLKLASKLQKLTNHFAQNYKDKILDPDLAVDFRKTVELAPGVPGTGNLNDSKLGGKPRHELILNKNVEVFINNDSKKANT